MDPSNSQGDSDLSVYSYLVALTFLAVIILVIRPVKVPLPIPAMGKKRKQLLEQQQQQRQQQHHHHISQQPFEQNGTEHSLPTGEMTAPPPSSSSSITLETAAAATATSIPLWKQRFPYHLTLGIATAPVLGVLFLLATTSIDGTVIKDGIVGAPDSGVQPYSVMILFFSLAYICISLDMTGIFQFTALHIAQSGGSSGQRVFFSFFLLSTVMSGLTSNDVVVLTMTPFLVYYAKAVRLETSVAFLMAEIQTANIASMLLYIGNITNVVACQAYKVSFIEYSAWMALPCFAAIAACYGMLRLAFRSDYYIPTTVSTPQLNPRASLVDPKGSIFGLTCLSLSLICLIGTSFAHVSVWIVTGPFALIVLCRDAWYDSKGRFVEHGDLTTTTTTTTAENSSDSNNTGDGNEGSDNVDSHGHHGSTFMLESRTATLATLEDNNVTLPPTALLSSLSKEVLESAAAASTSGPMSRGAVVRVAPGLELTDEEIYDARYLVVEDRRGSIISQHESHLDGGRDEKVEHQGSERMYWDEKNHHHQRSARESLAVDMPTEGQEQTKELADTAVVTVNETDLEAASPSTTSTTTMQQEVAPKPKRWFQQTWPLLYNIAIRMPWAILPFTFSMFIMVEGLSRRGWIGLFATWCTYLVPNYVAAVYAIGFLSVILCNIFNNVPMTILVARILQHPNFAASPVATDVVVKGCLFALIVGSNLGACTTLISSLAGLMWDTVLRNKGAGVGAWAYFSWNMKVMPVVIFAALSVVVIELTIIY